MDEKARMRFHMIWDMAQMRRMFAWERKTGSWKIT